MSTQNNMDLNKYQEPIMSKMQYGLPDLKKFYKKFLSRGLIFAIILHAFFISIYCVTLYLEAQAEKNLQIKRDIELRDIQSQENNQDQEDQAPPPEIEPQKIEALKDLAALTPEPVAKEKADLETIKKVEETEKIKAFVSSEGSENFDPTKETGKVKVEEKVVEEKVNKEKEKDNTKTKTYQQFEVDKAPVAVNLGQIQGSMRYPEIARSTGIEGKVTVKVLVGPDGSVISVGGFSGPDVFRSEVSSKVMDLQFTPALQQGQPVKCWVSVPFNFKLSGKFKKEDDSEKKEIKKEESKEEGK
ncbi:MAG: TonB family protein [Ignavibacteria bacterium]|jgi:protein TonB